MCLESVEFIFLPDFENLVILNSELMCALSWKLMTLRDLLMLLCHSLSHFFYMNLTL